MRALTLSAFVLLSITGFAQAQEATATCKDGTAWSGARRSGACRGHQGVQAFGTAAAVTAPAATTSPSVPAPTAPAPVAPAASTSAMVTGGGAGQVWVNTASKVYHCPGDRYYGHTKAGQYMTESAAKAAGDRPDHHKACSS